MLRLLLVMPRQKLQALLSKPMSPKKAFLLLLIFFASIVPLQAATIRELYEQAVAAFERQDFDHAIELYQQITKEAPNFAPAYVGIGLSLKSKGGDIDEVLYYYKTATDRDPTNAQAFEQTGRLYYSINKFDKAEKNFLKALSIDPGSASIKMSLGWLYLLAKSRPQTAIKYFKDVLRSDQEPNTYFGLGMAYFANNQRIEAIDIITKLHNMGQEDFAKRLEQMVRENQRVALQQPDEGDDQSEASEASKPAYTPPTQTGIKVRLREKLSTVD